MTDFTIPEEAAAVAFYALCQKLQIAGARDYDVDVSAMQYAIAAALPVMLSQRGWLGIDTIGGYTRIHESEDDFAHLKDKDWFIAVPLFRIKEPK